MSLLVNIIKGNINIIFNENNKITTLNEISPDNRVCDLITRYYKKNNIKKNKNKMIFLCNNEDISSEFNANKKIKDYIIKDSENQNLNILIIDMNEMKKMQKMTIKENGYTVFEIYLSKENTLKDLIDLYYKKKGIANKNKNSFSCAGEVINNFNKGEKNGDFQKNVENMVVLVNNI